jgi:hypothetical protein
MQGASKIMAENGGNTRDTGGSGNTVIYLAHLNSLSGHNLENDRDHHHLYSSGLRSKPNTRSKAMNFDDTEYANVIDLSLYRHPQRLTEHEESVFSGMAEELQEGTLVSEVVIGETDEGDTWLGVMNHYHEMMMHFEKISTEKWLYVFYPEHCNGDPDGWSTCVQELDGPVEVLRELSNYRTMCFPDGEGLSYA